MNSPRRKGILLVAMAVLLILAFLVYRQKSKKEETDLLANPDLVEQISDTTRLDLGVPENKEALWRGWAAVKTDTDGTTAAETYSKTATIRFGCLNRADKTILIRCRTIPGCSPSQLILPMINGHKLRGQRIIPTFGTYSFAAPASAFVLGVNALTFTFAIPKDSPVQKIGADFDFVHFGRVEEGMSSFQNVIRKGYFSTSHAILGPPSSLLNLYTKVPGNAKLNMEFGFKGKRGSSEQFSISVEDESKKRTELGSATLFDGIISRPSTSKTFDLKPYAGKIVRISLSAEPVPNTLKPHSIFWSDVSMKGQIPPSEIQTAAPLYKDKKPNIIIYLVDALRPDHLESYGYKIPTSPNIQNFSKDAAVFDNAYSQVSWTRSSVASIQTGLYPSSHLVEDRLDTLPEYLPTLPGELRKNGYRAVGFITNGNISALFHFDRSFDDYIRLGESLKRKEIHAQSGTLFETVSKYVSMKISPTSQPAFLYVHATDTHAPYTPDPQFQLTLPNCNADDPAVYNPDKNFRPTNEYTPEQIACIISLYDSEVLRSDYYFGQFLDLLKKKNLYDNSIIILTADHGESFFEHRVWGHGKTLYESDIRVPLIIRFPQNRFAGEHITQNVRHIDLFPTLLNAIGAPYPKGLQGTSLLPLVENPRNSEPPVFSELALDTHHLKAMVDDGYKMILNESNSRIEMYDLRNDPLETTDVAHQHQVRFHYMRVELTRWADEMNQRKATLRKPRGAQLDPDTAEALKALGYIQ
ncbi:MAG TPA: sulfatase [Acidobacteriota bacterium]|nr:sulfatase [Acidobacteriota bacterium]